MSNQWFRFYTEVLEDPKVQSLTPKNFKIWVNLLCLAGKTGGVLPPVKDVAFSLRLTNADTKSALLHLYACGLLDKSDNASDCYIIHSWGKRQYKSDVSTERVKRFRNGKGNGNETPPDTEADTDTEVVYNACANFERIYLAGSSLFPNLASASTSSIQQWLTAGCDPELDVIPELKRHIGKNIGAWTYFTNAITQAFATRTAPLPEVVPRKAFKTFDQEKRDQTDAAIEELMRRAKPN